MGWDGFTFDSIAEWHYYLYLKAELEAGRIRHLKIHPRFIVLPAFVDCDRRRVAPVRFTPDFQFEKNGRLYIHEVKGRRTDGYTVRKKLFLACFPDYHYVEIPAKEWL